MEDKELYRNILGITAPWKVETVDLQVALGSVTVTLAHDEGSQFPCPECEALCKVYDHRKRKWRHLDTCGFVTMIEAGVPRTDCPIHGIKQVKVPWAESGIGFTAMFEAVAISWLKAANTDAVAKQMRITWDETWGIMERAVHRGLLKRKLKPIKMLAIDETSFQKHHEYVTVLVDRSNGTVIDVLDDRKKVTLKDWLDTNKDSLTMLESVSMDMWDPFISSVQEAIPDAEKKICFDRFHVAGYFGKAVDKTRIEEHRSFQKGPKKDLLKRTKHDFLRSRKNNAYRHRNSFYRLSRMNLKTSRAWQIKETASDLWEFKYRGVAERNWSALLRWISRSRLKHMVAVGEMIREHLWGILNAIILKATNAIAESINATIQRIKGRACGFRNRSRFKIAILFHRGGLDLLPEGAY
jgi:transposase